MACGVNFWRFWVPKRVPEQQFSRVFRKARVQANNPTTQQTNNSTTRQPKNPTTQLPNHPTPQQPNKPTPKNPTIQQPNNPTTQQPNKPTPHQPTQQRNRTAPQPNGPIMGRRAREAFTIILVLLMFSNLQKHLEQYCHHTMGKTLGNRLLNGKLGSTLPMWKATSHQTADPKEQHS